ncbi:hypothetical protein SpCBS45565_g04667 [Spizellomyces sp. 'palustris']|nr:hypothetical protein SpCBS45565_g04667 [Spizellomyces sp. 'palustris']
MGIGDLITAKCPLVPNHIRLFHSIYPVRGKKIIPKSNEFSRLVFYLRSKPHKVFKVGPLLAAHNKSDIRHRRWGHVQINLQLARTLIEECHSLIAIVGPAALSVIYSILTSTNQLMEDATTVFREFCQHYMYQPNCLPKAPMHNYLFDLIMHFSGMCLLKDNDEDFVYTSRTCGLAALEAVIHSKGFVAHPRLRDNPEIDGTTIKGGPEYVRMMMHATLANINDPTKVPTDPSPITERTENDFSDPEQVAGRCLTHLFSLMDLESLPVFLAPIVNIVDFKRPSKEYAVNVFRSITTCTRPEYRHGILKHFTDVIKQPDAHQARLLCDPSVKETMFEIICTLMELGCATGGMSFLELCEALLEQLHATRGVENAQGLQDAVMKSFAILVKKVAHPHQLAEMQPFLVSKLGISTAEAKQVIDLLRAGDALQEAKLILMQEPVKTPTLTSTSSPTESEASAVEGRDSENVQATEEKKFGERLVIPGQKPPSIHSMDEKRERHRTVQLEELMAAAYGWSTPTESGSVLDLHQEALDIATSAEYTEVDTDELLASITPESLGM